MANVYTVSQINNYIRNMFENDYLLRNVQITGELSNVKYHSSGHIYFSLKEEGSMVNCVMFRSSRAQGLDFTLDNGQKVIITGNVSVYERDGRYQIYARRISLDGRGNLYEAYERLKQKLYEEGLFEFEDKKPIPKYPKKVGIVTAATGAAIRDIQNIAKRRNPYVQLYLYPALVQGEEAAQTIVKGIETLDNMGMDTIIIGRGGGSIEDLWPFNEEMVARAIFAAQTPIISGTGHEIDNTIADYVADLRAPTPSAACELAIPDVMSLVYQLREFERHIKQSVNRIYRSREQNVSLLSTRLNTISPKSRFDNQKVYFDSLCDRIMQSANTKYQIRKHQYDLLLAKLNGLSPTARLVGGYGYIEDKSGHPLHSVKEVEEGQDIHITLWDGTMRAKISEKRLNNKSDG